MLPNFFRFAPNTLKNMIVVYLLRCEQKSTRNWPFQKQIRNHYWYFSSSPRSCPNQRRTIILNVFYNRICSKAISRKHYWSICLARHRIASTSGRRFDSPNRHSLHTKHSEWNYSTSSISGYRILLSFAPEIRQKNVIECLRFYIWNLENMAYLSK